VLGEVHRRERRGDLVGHPLAPSQQRAERKPERGRDVDVLEHRELVEDRRLLERAADADADDRVLLAPDQLLPREHDRAARRADEVGDRVDERRLAGAVGTDDEAHLVLVEDEVETVDRVELVERDDEVGDLQQLRAHREDRPCESSRTIDEQWRAVTRPP
jgi:hypothetical protein